MEKRKQNVLSVKLYKDVEKTKIKLKKLAKKNGFINHDKSGCINKFMNNLIENL